jgi:HEPN domain-containing protein
MAGSDSGDEALLRWNKGRDVVEKMLSEGSLTRVQASRELADQCLETARKRMQIVPLISAQEPTGAFSLAYDAARLALTAVLLNEGLRPRGEGAHVILLQAVLAQTEPPRQEAFREFSWIRKLRNDTQYPDVDRPMASLEDLNQAIPAIQVIIERATVLVEHMPPF